MKPVVHSQKHYVQISRSTCGTGVRVQETLIDSVDTPATGTVDEVVEGAIVKAIFVELWVIDQGADASFSINLAKFPSGLGAMSYANAIALGTYENKKNVFYATQGLTPNDGIAQPVPLIRQWFKIPKSKQRFGLGDKIRLTIANAGLQDLYYCGMVTYKEYT